MTLECLADYVVLGEDGVLFMTERSLMLFDARMRVSWRIDEDFLGWTLESVEAGRIGLGFSGWSGKEERQARTLADGQRIL